jgi:hypothetical protein
MEVRGARAPVVINKQIYLIVLFLLPSSFSYSANLSLLINGVFFCSTRGARAPVVDSPLVGNVKAT